MFIRYLECTIEVRTKLKIIEAYVYNSYKSCPWESTQKAGGIPTLIVISIGWARNVPALSSSQPICVPLLGTDLLSVRKG